MMNDLSEGEEEDSNRDDSINTPRLLVEVQLYKEGGGGGEEKHGGHSHESHGKEESGISQEWKVKVEEEEEQVDIISNGLYYEAYVSRSQGRRWHMREGH